MHMFIYRNICVYIDHIYILYINHIHIHKVLYVLFLLSSNTITSQNPEYYLKQTLVALYICTGKCTYLHKLCI